MVAADPVVFQAGNHFHEDLRHGEGFVGCEFAPRSEAAPSKPVDAHPPDIASASVLDTFARLGANPETWLTLMQKPVGAVASGSFTGALGALTVEARARHGLRLPWHDSCQQFAS